VSSIKPNDLNELKKLGKPSDVIKLIFDCVSLLKMAPLMKVDQTDVTLGIGANKKTFMFIKDSYKIAQSGLLSDTRFLQMIMQFSRVEKDFINDETVEFMAPYLELEGFNALTARNASKAAEGLCTWCRAMSDYHGASKIVKPKLEALRLAEAKLQDAERELYKAEMRLKSCQEVLSGSIFYVYYLCLIGRVYMFYVGHVDKSSLYETHFHYNILSKHHHHYQVFNLILINNCQRREL
jgi:dynein heavy chain